VTDIWYREYLSVAAQLDAITAERDALLYPRLETVMGFDGFPSKPGDNPALDIIEELRAKLAAERANGENWKKANRLLIVQYDAERERTTKLREALVKAMEWYDENIPTETLAAIDAVLEETKGDGDE
jgi:hypothetical protein